MNEMEPLAWLRRRIRQKLDGRYVTQARMAGIIQRLTLIEAGSDSTSSQAIACQLRELLTPVPSGHLWARIGSQNDGGYILPADILDGLDVLSVGVGNEVSADEYLAIRGHNVVQLDHTIEDTPSNHPRIQWHKVGIAGENSASNPQMISLKRAVRTYMEPRVDKLLLMDVEGAEWNVFHDDSDALNDFVILAVELHGLEMAFDSRHVGYIMKALRNMLGNHKVVSVAVNNAAPILTIAGVKVPTVIEVTLVRHDRFIPGPGIVPGSMFGVNDITQPPVSHSEIFEIEAPQGSVAAPSFMPPGRRSEV